MSAARKRSAGATHSRHTFALVKMNSKMFGAMELGSQKRTSHYQQLKTKNCSGWTRAVNDNISKTSSHDSRQQFWSVRTEGKKL